MKKVALLIAIAAFAATPAVAASKKKPESEFDKAMAQNKKNLSLIVQGLPLILPTWSLPIYFKMQEDADQPKPAKKKPAKKKKKM
jgi:hypothetical protein